MAKSTFRVRNDQGFGGYYGSLRRWKNVKRADRQWHDMELPGAVEPESDGLTWDEWATAEDKFRECGIS